MTSKQPLKIVMVGDLIETQLHNVKSFVIFYDEPCEVIQIQLHLSYWDKSQFLDFLTHLKEFVTGCPFIISTENPNDQASIEGLNDNECSFQYDRRWSS